MLLLLPASTSTLAYDKDTNWAGWGLNSNWTTPANWGWADVPDYFGENAVFKKDATVTIDKTKTIYGIRIGWGPSDSGIAVTMYGPTGSGTSTYLSMQKLVVPASNAGYLEREMCTLTLESRATIASDRTEVGGGAPGTVTVDGGALVTNTLILSPRSYVNGKYYNNDHGELYCRNGGKLETGEAIIGESEATGSSADDTTPARLEVSGSGTRWLVDRLRIAPYANARGEVWIKDGALVIVSDEFSLPAHSALRLHGGTLRVDSAFARPGGSLDFASGTLDLRFAVTLKTTGPLGSSLTLGAGKTLKTTVLDGLDYDISLAGGVLNAGVLKVRPWTFTDTAASTTWVNSATCAGTLHLLGTLNVGGAGPSGYAGNLTVSGSGGVKTLRVDKALNIKSGKLSVRAQGTLTVDGEVKLQAASSALELRSGGTLTAKSLDCSTGTLSLLGGEFIVDGGALKLPPGWAVDASAPVSLTFRNGGTAAAPASVTIGTTQTSEVTQTDGVLSTGDAMRIGRDGGTGRYVLAGSAQLNNKSILSVGHTGTGTLDLDAGINRVSGYLYIGQISGSEGTYNVDGGTLSAGRDVFVGGSHSLAGGTGTLNINSGTATVAGTLKLWPGGTLNLNGGTLTVGKLDSSLGTVNWNGGQLKFSGEVRIGTNGNYGSTVTLDDASAHLDAPAGVSVITGGSLTARDGGTVDASGSHCKVGNGGVGTLTVANGGTVASSSGYVGVDTGGSGTATISGTGRWTNAGGLHVGGTAQGTLTIQGGGTVTSTTGRVASETGSQGTVTVDGGTWNSGSYLTVGRYGTGSMTIRNGGVVTNTDTYVGAYSGSNGALTVTGAATTYAPGGSVYLGSDGANPGGTGRLLVDESAEVTIPGTLGIWPGGTLALLHDNAQATTRSLRAEDAFLDIRKGTFIVDGGSVSGSNLTVQGETSYGAYTRFRGVGGSLSGWLTLGDTAYANLYLLDGSLSLGGTFTLGKQGGARGYYTQEGAAALSGTTAVFGHGGKGVVDQNGGSLYLKNNLYLGNASSTAEGEYNLRQYAGATTSLSASSLIVGNQGTGRLTQQQGAITVRSALYMGYASGGKGYFTNYPGAGALTVNGSTFVGYGGLGRLTLESSAPVTCKGTVRIGNSKRADGTLTLKGGVELRNEASYQVVGYQGKGAVSQSGTSTNQVSKYLYIAEQSTSTGTYDLAGGTLTVGNDLCVGGNTGAAGGTGTLTISAGEVHVAGTLRLWGRGTVTISGGKVYVDVVDNTHGGAFHLNGGELHVREFRGDLTNNGGKVCPGSSPGTTTILGDYLQGPGGTLQIELSDVSDLLTVTGQMSLGGNLEVLPFAGFPLVAGVGATCLDWGELAGQFDGLSLPALPAGIGWDLSALYTDGQLSIANLLGPFAVSGTVRDAALAGLADATVTARVGIILAGTATTGADGSYALTLPPGIYTVTATKLGSTFQPASRSVTVAAAPVVGVDFAGSGAPATYSVRGTARTAEGYALAGVLVTTGGKTALTASDGGYHLSGLVAGTYTFVPARAGYVFDPASVEREVSADVTDLDFTAAVGSYTIGGTVRDDGGMPLAGATVMAGGLATTTAEDGTYTLAGLFPGPCVVVPLFSGYTFAPALQAFALAGDQTAVDFAGTANPYAVSGTVRDGEGAPLADVTVVAGDRAAVTAEDGTYTIERLAAGVYPVTPFGEELVFAPLTQAATVGPSQTGVDFVGSTATYTISGLVANGATPLAGVTVTAGSATATTDATGTYILTGLVAGSYVATPSLADYVFDPESTPVVVGPDRTAVDFAATPAPYEVGGVVRDGEGAGLAGVTVTLGERTTTTDATGAYLFENLVDGTYTVTPSAPERTFTPASTDATVGPSQGGVDFTGVPTTYTVSGTVTDGADPMSGVTVSAGSESVVTGADGTFSLVLVAGQYDITPTLAAFAFTPDARAVIVGPAQAGVDFVGAPDVYTISGVATDSEAQPLAGVEVTIGATTLTTDAGGAYEFTGLAPGTYDVGAVLPEYTFAAASQSITVGPDQTAVNFAGAINTYTIGGTARDGAGLPLADVTVTLGETTTATAADGTYEFPGLTAGTYEIIPALDETVFAPASHTVTVGPDAPATDFVGTLNTYSVSGTVRDGSDAPLAGIEVTGGGQTVATAADGTYTLAGLTAGTVVVEPSAEHLVFTPQRQILAVGPDQADIDFVGAADGDDDGTADAIENAAPNGGDGNSDGTQDAVQAYVVSLPNGEDGDYVTLIADPSLAFANTHTDSSPEPGDAPMALDLPGGMVTFELHGVTPGGAATVTLVFHDEPTSPAYYAVGGTGDNAAPHWYEFPYDGTVGAQLAGSTALLHFVDGADGDHDLAADGIIQHSGGPGAVLAPTVDGVTPAAAVSGQTVTISGTGLTGASAVSFAGSAATFEVTGDTAIAAVVPAAAVPGRITVTTPGGTATSPEDFTPLAPHPEMDLQRAAGVSIADGGSDDLGTHAVGTVSVTYTVDNTAGTATLQVTDVTAAALVNCGGFSLGTALPLPVAAGDTETIGVSFAIAGPGAFSLDLAIANDDGDESPYDISLQGVGYAPADPAGSCLVFDGTDDYVDCGSHASLLGMAALTLEAWVRPDANDVERVILSTLGTDGESGGYQLSASGQDDATTWGVTFRDQNYGEWRLAGTTVFEAGMWYHVCATLDCDGTDTIATLYVNGVVEGEATFFDAQPDYDSASPLYVGTNRDGTPGGGTVVREFRGRIDEAAVWNRALSGEEIRDRMHLKRSGSETGLVGCWHFDEGGGAAAADALGNSDGTLHGGPAWGASTVPLAEAAVAALNQVRGVWDGTASSLASGRLGVADATLTAPDFAVFGHDGGTDGWQDGDVPPGIAKRLARVWRFQVSGSVNDDTAVDTTGLADIGDGSRLRLLTDPDGTFADAAVAAGAFADSVLVVAAGSLADGTHCTLALAEPPGFTISETNGGTLVNEPATQDTFTVVLDTQPTADVVFTVTSSDTDEATVSPATLVFTPADWQVPQTVTVTGVDDGIDDGDQTIHVTVAVDDANSTDLFDDLADQTVAVTVSVRTVAPGHTATLDAAGNLDIDGNGTTDYVLVGGEEITLGDGSILQAAGAGPGILLNVLAGASATLRQTADFVIDGLTMNGGGTLTVEIGTRSRATVIVNDLTMAPGDTLTYPDGTDLVLTGTTTINGDAGYSNLATIRPTTDHGGITVTVTGTATIDHVHFMGIDSGFVKFQGATALDHGLFTEGDGTSPYVIYEYAAAVTWTNLAFRNDDGATQTIQNTQASANTYYVQVDGYTGPTDNYIGGDSTDVEPAAANDASSAVRWSGATPAFGVKTACTAPETGGVLVQWSARVEIGVLRYLVQVAQETSWTTVGDVFARTEGLSSASYEFLDRLALPKEPRTYRLLCVDVDGRIHEHAVGEAVAVALAPALTAVRETIPTFPADGVASVEPLSFSVQRHATETPAILGTARKATVATGGLYQTDGIARVYSLGAQLPDLGGMVYIRPYRDPYADTNVVWGCAEAPAIVGEPGVPPAPAAQGLLGPEGYVAIVHVERDETLALNSMLPPGPNWFYGYTNRLAPGNAPILVANVPAPAATGTATIRVSVRSTTDGDHDLGVTVNGRPIARAVWSGKGFHGVTVPFDLATCPLLDGDNHIQLWTTAAGSSKRLDYLEVTTPATPVLRDGSLVVDVLDGATDALDVPGAVHAVDITEFANESLLATRRGAVRGLRAGRRIYFAAATGTLAWGEPKDLTAVDTALAGRQYVAVAPAAWLDALAPLVAKHEAEGFASVAVSWEDVRDTYGCGLPTPAALVRLGQRARPQYLLIGAGASHDPKGLQGDLPPAGIATGFVHVYEGTASTDDLYTGDFTIAVGRLPARNRTELLNMVNKIVDFQPGRRAVMMADVDDATMDFGAFAALQAELADRLPSVLLDANTMGGTALRTALIAAIHNGANLVTYQGHGNNALIGDKFDILNTSHAAQIPPSAWLFATCLTGVYTLENDSTDVLASELLRRAGNGAVAVLASTCYGQAATEHRIVEEAVRRIAAGEATWGDILLEMKRALLPNETAAVYTLLGDPAMRALRVGDDDREILIDQPLAGGFINGAANPAVRFRLRGNWWDESLEILWRKDYGEWRSLGRITAEPGISDYAVPWDPPPEDGGGYQLMIREAGERSEVRK